MERLQEITREIALQDIQTLYRHTAFWMEQNDLTQIVNAYFDYKQAEQDGLMVRLPCKVGTTVYRIWVVDGRKPVISTHKMISESMICQWKYQFGKTVFLTKEDAEKTLKGDK